MKEAIQISNQPAQKNIVDFFQAPKIEKNLT